LQRRRSSSSIKNYIGLVLETAGFRANSNLIIFKNPTNEPSYKEQLYAEEWQLLKSSLPFELKYKFLFSLLFKQGT